ncbi:hypothetical protein CEXT_287961 [Caerostris extrusa]|uniref:Uncharacterized protein n=1 Tax=Caerostris extrusa TaxID=172846 RepID=A0AAV4T965_CAEEX|nr:hypothetical protein CEXT_287961 [Caerostris extrusa]
MLNGVWEGFFRRDFSQFTGMKHVIAALKQLENPLMAENGGAVTLHFGSITSTKLNSSVRYRLTMQSNNGEIYGRAFLGWS